MNFSNEGREAKEQLKLSHSTVKHPELKNILSRSNLYLSSLEFRCPQYILQKVFITTLTLPKNIPEHITKYTEL